MVADAQWAEGMVVEEGQEEQQQEEKVVVVVVVKECRRGMKGLHMVGVDWMCLREVEGVTSQSMRKS